MPDNELPEGWTTATIGDTAEYINGRGFKKSEWEGEGRPIIRIQNLTGTADEFNYTTLDVDEKYVVPSGTILVSWSATLDTFRWHGPEGVLNQHIFKVVPNEELVEEDFLFWLLKREIQEMVRAAKLQGSTMKHIRRDSFLDHEFPLPPKPEQRRIADRLDAIQSRTQATGETLDQVPDRIEEYRQSVLNAAFTGRLTADWREDHSNVEPGKELLEQILSERHKQWKKDYRAKYEAKGKEPPSGWKSRYSEPVEPDEYPNRSVPDSWTWAGMNSVFQWSNGDSLTKDEQQDGPYAVYGGNGVKGSHTDYMVDTETVVIGRVGANCGNVHLAQAESWITDNAIYADWQSGLIDEQFVVRQLRHLRLNRIAGGSGQPYISQKKLNSLAIALPPYEEQVEISRRIQQRLDKIDEMARHVEQAGERLDHLDRSVLAKAFRGELVETEAERARREDRDYETAEELLERVRGESSSEEQSTSSEEQPSTTTQVDENGQFEMKVVDDDPDL